LSNNPFTSMKHVDVTRQCGALRKTTQTLSNNPFTSMKHVDVTRQCGALRKT